jgi:hypothetical protein
VTLIAENGGGSSSFAKVNEVLYENVVTALKKSY